MDAEKILIDNDYEGVKFLTNYSYDDALIGVTTDNRAVYSYEKMIIWLMETEGFDELEAIEWIEVSTIRSLPYFGEGAPVIIYELERHD